MALKSFRPLTASLRFTTLNRPEGISKNRPERSLVESKSKTGGRNTYGRITSRRRGGGHKKLYRIIDFKRSKLDMAAKVQSIEYDPNRTALLALLAYADGTKTYVLAPQGLKAGDKEVVEGLQRIRDSMTVNVKANVTDSAATQKAAEGIAPKPAEKP